MRIRSWSWTLVVLACLGALSDVTWASARTRTTRHWRAAWAAAMDDLTAPSLWHAHPLLPGTPTPPQVTYRFIVRPTVSGTAVRLRNVTFKGRRKVTVAPGASVVSDSVGLQVTAFEDLTVGVYVPRSVVAAAVTDPANPLQLRPRFDSGDHLHPNAAGFRAMASRINLKLLRRAFAGSLR